MKVSELKIFSKPSIIHNKLTPFLKGKYSQQKERLYNKFEKRRRSNRSSINISYRNSRSKQSMLKILESIKTIIDINTTKGKFSNCLKINNTEEAYPFVLFNSTSFSQFFQVFNIVQIYKSFADYLINLSDKTYFSTPLSLDEVENIVKH